jgi:tetratricopeptide (TPR) repeat protein
MKNQETKYSIAVMIGFLFCLYSGCHIPEVVHDYWWNHYEQGIKHSDKEEWQAAEKYFKMAIHDRYDSKIHALTYGFKYIIYLPHRELGYVLYKQERFQEAIQELETALSFEYSKKAKIYLDRARIKMHNKTTSDIHPPEIFIQNPLSSEIVNTTKVIIRGYVQDDSYVGQIKIADQFVQIPISKKEVLFCVEQSVKQGKNEIPIYAKDIFGNRTKSVHFIHVDLVAPVLSVDWSIKNQSTSMEKASLSIYAFDDYGIEKVNIGSKDYFYNNKKNIALHKEIEKSSNQENVCIKVYDIAGNVNIKQVKLVSSRNHKLLLASNSLGTDLPYLVAQLNRNRIPISEVDSHESKIIIDTEIPNIIYEDSIMIQGRVKDLDGIKSLYMSGTEISVLQKNEVKFSYIYPLVKEKNVIVIRVIDSFDNEISERVKTFKKEASVYIFNQRAKIQMTDFNIIQPTSKPVKQPLLLKKSFLTKFRYNILKQKRFSISSTDSQNIIDYYISGECSNRYSEIEIFLFPKLNKRSSEDNITSINVFQEFEGGKSGNIDYLINLMDDLAEEAELSIRQKIPLIEGKLIGCKNSQITISAGSERGIKKGMKLIIFNKIDISDFKILGEAEVTETFEDRSNAIIIASSSLIKPEHFFLTK